MDSAQEETSPAQSAAAQAAQLLAQALESGAHLQPGDRLAQLQWEDIAGPNAAGLAFCTHKTHTLLHDETALVPSAGGEHKGGPQGSQAQNVAAAEPVEQEVKDDEMEQELAEAVKADPMAGRHLIEVCPSHQQLGACTLLAFIASKAR